MRPPSVSPRINLCKVKCILKSTLHPQLGNVSPCYPHLAGGEPRKMRPSTLQSHNKPSPLALLHGICFISDTDKTLYIFTGRSWCCCLFSRLMKWNEWRETNKMCFNCEIAALLWGYSHPNQVNSAGITTVCNSCSVLREKKSHFLRDQK